MTGKLLSKIFRSICVGIFSKHYLYGPVPSCGSVYTAYQLKKAIFLALHFIDLIVCFYKMLLHLY